MYWLICTNSLSRMSILLFSRVWWLRRDCGWRWLCSSNGRYVGWGVILYLGSGDGELTFYMSLSLGFDYFTWTCFSQLLMPVMVCEIEMLSYSTRKYCLCIKVDFHVIWTEMTCAWNVSQNNNVNIYKQLLKKSSLFGENK